MRLTRTGAKLSYQVAPLDANEFQELYSADLGTEDVTTVRLGINTGGQNAIDMRVMDLRVRSPEGK